MLIPAPCTITLPDGRTLAFDDVGAPAGVVVVYFHGAPDCRLARHPDDGLAEALGVRLIAVDRPGYGRSDPTLDPMFAPAADDIGHLLDALGVATCRLLAWSAGGPRALAAATALGDRCTGVTAYAPISPAEAAVDPAAITGMRRRQAVLSAAVDDGVAPSAIAAEVGQFMLPVVPVPAELALELVRDSLGRRSLAEVGSVPGLLEMLAASHVEASAVHGRAGVEGDMVAELTFGQLDDVLGPTCLVRLVYGDRDQVAGPPVGEWYRARLRRSTLEVWSGASHHALFPRWAELLS
ncbi:MAG: alpha/beta hydrolase [Acidimicrobiales bacterium]